MTFARLSIILAQGLVVDAAAFLALSNGMFWIELYGLPPSPAAAGDSTPAQLEPLTRKMIFGTDWPGVPSIAVNARAVTALCPTRRRPLAWSCAGNALRVYNLKLPA